MLMGTADTLAAGPKEKIVFEEDLSAEQKNLLVQGPSQVGLQNLGNTCYMNSTVQALRNVPELKSALESYSSSQRPAGVDEGSHRIAQQLGGLYKSLNGASQPLLPIAFTNALRQVFPQFDQTNAQGAHMQQDAEECFSQILSSLATALKANGSSGATNVIDQVFGGELSSTVKCAETDSEPEQKNVEKFRRLQVHIENDINFLHDGILAGLKETFAKRSPSLGRDAQYLKKSVISQVPSHLVVHFVRFFWRRDTEKKAKVLKKVAFPLTLDIQPYTTPELSKSIAQKRGKQMDDEARKLGIEDSLKKSDKSAASTTGVAPMEVEQKTAEPETALILNHSGYYELSAVVTHQGRLADSGHYIGWVKMKDDAWLKFDDDVVTPCNNEDILKLCGGGDWHMAYLLIYRLALDSDPQKSKAKK